MKYEIRITYKKNNQIKTFYIDNKIEAIFKFQSFITSMHGSLSNITMVNENGNIIAFINF